MLLRFKVQNFLSFNEFVDNNPGTSDGIEFSMIPGKVKTKSRAFNQKQTSKLFTFWCFIWS